MCALERSEVYRREFDNNWGAGRTVDGRLVALAADLALQLTKSHLLLELNGDRLFVVAEEAAEVGGQRIGLIGKETMLARTVSFVGSKGIVSNRACALPTLRGPLGLRELFFLPIVAVCLSIWT